MVGAQLNPVLQLTGMSGITIEDDALSFSPEQVAHLRGHIASVTTGPEGLTFLYTAQHRRARASAKVVKRDSADVLIHAVAQIAADSVQVQCLSS